MVESQISEGLECQGEFTVVFPLKAGEPLKIFEQMAQMRLIGREKRLALERLILEALAILGEKKFVPLIELESCKWDHYKRHYEGYTLFGCISRYLR